MSGCPSSRTSRHLKSSCALGKQLTAQMLTSRDDLANRVAKMRRKFAEEYGFVVPDIQLTDSLTINPKSYEIKIHGTVIASHELRVGELLVLSGPENTGKLPGEPTREPAFGMPGIWVPTAYADEVKRIGMESVDNTSIVLTHLSEVIRNNLPQLLSYKDMRSLLDRLDKEYKRLIDDICPAHISYSGLQAVLKLLLAERVSIRNLHLILEAIAEIAPHVRRSEQVVEHVRIRMGQQICGDLANGGKLAVIRLGNKWDLAFHDALKRDAKGEVVEFDIDPHLVEQFGEDLTKLVREKSANHQSYAILTTPDARSYVRMIVERLFPTLPVLSHLEVVRGVDLITIGNVS